MNRHFTLITGASGGIGLELAKLFARDKKNLVLVARSKEKLETISQKLVEDYGVEVITIAKDLSRVDSSTSLYEEIKSKDIFIETLVNNAGFGTSGEFSDSDLNSELLMISLNVLSLVVLTRLVLSDMTVSGTGRILNISSTSAFQPVPNMASYGATKSFVLSFSEAIRVELEGYGIQVTTLCPGPTKTEFFESAKVKTSKSFEAKLMSPEKVAKVGYIALKKKKHIAVPGLSNKFLSRFARILPFDITARIARRSLDGER
jgi:hypothetical protein